MLEWLAKFSIFAKVANWLRTVCELVAKFRLGCEMVAKFPALLLLSDFQNMLQNLPQKLLKLMQEKLQKSKN